ncbi:FkbM family methyltransferase [Terracoccus sp. 273MFTsu3.1]|uniref:FkbM family methyltransferase n=1 Tax=Terracoccus sp. 273MFTsu3.1 TaxID=1172188 RepID=UPI00036AA5AA|nr:FkbM family methyltransferase [Terracoccus sp. 273MFTsu3.1]
MALASYLSRDDLRAAPVRLVGRRVRLELTQRLRPSLLSRERTFTYAGGALTARMPLDDSIGRALYLYDVYEWPTALTLATLARPGTTCVDVGAHVGSYAALASLAVGPAGRVLAFEPDATNRERLERHVRLNDLANVVVLDHGLADVESEVAMVRPVAANSGMTRLARSGETPDFSMGVRRLDDVLAGREAPSVSVVKIDVEGAEVAVVRGAADLIARDQPFVVFEENDPECGAHLTDTHGYRLYRITPDGYVDRASTAARRDDAMAPNVLAVPPGAELPRLPRPSQVWPRLRHDRRR